MTASLPRASANGRALPAAALGALWLSAALLGPSSALAGEQAAGGPPADYVFRGGRVYTLDERQPWAEAVAVRGKDLAYVGTDAGSARWIGPKTKVVDLAGRMLMPGFVDGHNHYASGATAKRGVNLVGSKDEAELLQRIRAYVKANPGRAFYLGFGWEFPMLGEKGGLRQALDAICADKPLMFFNEDNHHAWFNTRAMTMAGVGKASKDPVPGGSYFRRGPDGTPSGIAIEPDSWGQMAIKTGVLSGREMIREGVAQVLPVAARAGITAYHDMGIWAPDFPQGDQGLEVLAELERAGQLPVRVVGVYGIRDGKAAPEAHVRTLKAWSERFRTELIQVTGLKVWADGVFLAHTGVQLEPYADQPETRGESDWTTDVLSRWIEAAYAAGFDVNVHSDGDLAVRRSLDAVERVTARRGPSPRRTTLHHLPTIHPDDLPRFKALGVGVNMTPVWLVDYKGQYGEAKRIFGAEKVEREYGQLRPLLAAGVNVTFGSDIPGTDLDEVAPLFQIQAAVTGRVPGAADAQTPPADRLPSLEQMLLGYTLAGARQLRLADRIGSLEAGKRADLIVLEKDLFQVPPDRLAATAVELTMMNGKITHQAQGWAGAKAKP